jgi:hypothetical protein
MSGSLDDVGRPSANEEALISPQIDTAVGAFSGKAAVIAVMSYAFSAGHRQQNSPSPLR